MTGNPTREKVSHIFKSPKDLEKTIETLINDEGDRRAANSVSDLVKIIMQM